MPGYLGNSPGTSSVKVARQQYSTSGAATTDFTFAAGYIPGYLEVYVGGSKQTESKNYTASDGSTFSILNGGVGTGQTVEAVAYKAFNVATVSIDDLQSGGDLVVDSIIAGTNVTANSGGVNVSGVVTATSFAGSATGLTGTPSISVTGVTASGIGTFSNKVIIGVANTITQDGYINSIGIVTAQTLSVAGLTTISGGDLKITGDITCHNLTVAGITTSEDVTNVDSTGIVTARGGLKVGAPTGTATTVGNDGDISASGIVTAWTSLHAVDNTGIGFTANKDGAVTVGVITATTLVGALTGNATGLSGTPNITVGFTTVTNFEATGTLVEAFSSTTTAYSSSGDLNISNGNLQFCSANLAGTNNTLNIMSTTGINTDLATGQALNVTAITAVNASTAYVNQITIDGKAVTETWVGGSAPTDGGSSGYDTYSFNILKTGSETFICIANQVKTS